MLEKVKKMIAKVTPMLSLLLPLILIAMLSLSVSCLRQTPIYTDITVEEAYEMLKQQEVVVLDVRTQKEYDFSHIPDAILIPLSELESKLNELNPSDHILVYDYSNNSSKEAALLLVDNGFMYVYNMEGGLAFWKVMNFPLIFPYADLTSEEAYDLIRQQDVVIVDLRTQEKYDFLHIPNSLLIPQSELESRLDELNPTDHILVYHNCISCSREGAQTLIDNGFLYVYHLKEGIGRWQAQGFPVISVYRDISAEEAYDMLNQQDVVIVDLRTQEDYDAGHIPDALHIPQSELESRLDELNPTDHILVYHGCSPCSREIAQILVENGFLYVYRLDVGLLWWRTQGFPVTPEAK